MTGPAADPTRPAGDLVLPPILWWSPSLAVHREHDDSFAPGVIAELGDLDVYYTATDDGWTAIGDLPADARRLVVDHRLADSDTAPSVPPQPAGDEDTPTLMDQFHEVIVSWLGDCPERDDVPLCFQLSRSTPPQPGSVDAAQLPAPCWTAGPDDPAAGTEHHASEEAAEADRRREIREDDNDPGPPQQAPDRCWVLAVTGEDDGGEPIHYRSQAEAMQHIRGAAEEGTHG